MESAHDTHNSSENTVSFTKWFIPLVVLLVVISGFLSIVNACSSDAKIGRGEVGTESKEMTPAASENKTVEAKEAEGSTTKEMPMPADSAAKEADSKTKK